MTTLVNRTLPAPMPGRISSILRAARPDGSAPRFTAGRRLAELVAASAFAAAPFAFLGLAQGGAAGVLAAAPAAALGIGAVLMLARNRIAPAARPDEALDPATMRSLIEKVRDGVLRMSPDGKVAFASASAAQFLGAPRYALAGTGLFDRIHVLDRPAWLTAFDHARRTGAVRALQLRLRCDDPDGPPRAPRFVWTAVEISPAAEAGELVVILEDITDQKAREADAAAIAAARDALPDDRARVFATIGHELRTPLNAMVGFAEMMTSGISGPLNETQKDYAGLIGRSGRHLIGVVDMLLDLSRLEAGRVELSPTRFDPSTIIAPSFALLEPMAAEHGVRLISQLPGALPQISADERAFRQILTNLVSNAIKFSRKDGVVTVSMRRQGANLCLQVADTGIGMGPDCLARLGEPFFQGQQGFDRRYEGTGLGLSIVKGLAALHGGRMVAMSSPGEGTVMSVLLPINGPATKVEETAEVVSLDRDPVPTPMSIWPDARRSAR